MFDLDREVTAWANSVHAERCRAAAGAAELTDHLYCEIERGRAEGLSDEEAFRAAVARLGSASALMAEEAKNRSALGTVCQVAAKLDGAGVRPDHRGALLAHALIWASLIIATSMILSKTAVRDVYSLLLMVVFVPLWWASDQLLRSVLRRQGAR
jgi:hypothetical protein